MAKNVIDRTKKKGKKEEIDLEKAITENPRLEAVLKYSAWKKKKRMGIKFYINEIEKNKE